MVKVIGALTDEAVPGLNRHCRKALTAALSSMGLPMLELTSALVTLPLAGSTCMVITPLPVMCRERASYGYWGRGAYKARAFARDIDIGPGALIGVNFCAFCGWRGGGVLSSTNSGLMSGGGGGSGIGISSGGGVASGGANTASTTVGGWEGSSTGGASCL
jgi:hypothetical protein